MTFTPEQLEAEKDRLDFQHGSQKGLAAQFELLWFRLFNKDHYRLTTLAWKELEQ